MNKDSFKTFPSQSLFCDDCQAVTVHKKDTIRGEVFCLECGLVYGVIFFYGDREVIFNG